MIRLAILLILILPSSLYSVRPPDLLPNVPELNCLISNVYYEARGESIEGKIAVALVTLNRLEHKNYPKTICDVVYQNKQFSWTNKYKYSEVSVREWEASAEAAITAYLNRSILGYFDATHYHNFTVAPNWKLKKVTTINNHIFYK